ncbi:MAG: hypothetical protein H6813_05120 [Phycisphaeraceae bacterium]|nr:hypothetical protein [Phycisphaeraceae bacterium]MCB9847765.1 hypothetical protein [Phycisphaeraceae bacterium]
MSVLPTNNSASASIAASVSGVKSTEADSTNKAKRKSDAETRFKRALDEADVSVDAAQAADAVRNAKGNDQEEAHEDRQEHGFYQPGHLDIEG